MRRAVFADAKIIHVMEGRATVETTGKAHVLEAGTSFALGAGRWCSLVPEPNVRFWTVYADEEFLRAHMSWALPIRERVIRGIHPLDWTGAPVTLYPGIQYLRRIEPIWRQMSVLGGLKRPPEFTAARSVALFSRAVELSIQTFLLPSDFAVASEIPPSHPVRGNLSAPVIVGHAGRAAQILRTRMDEPWSVDKLAKEVALSRTHLSRLFTRQLGVPPMRFLTELRWTEP